MSSPCQAIPPPPKCSTHTSTRLERGIKRTFNDLQVGRRERTRITSTSTMSHSYAKTTREEKNAAEVTPKTSLGKTGGDCLEGSSLVEGLLAGPPKKVSQRQLDRGGMCAKKNLSRYFKGQKKMPAGNDDDDLSEVDEGFEETLATMPLTPPEDAAGKKRLVPASEMDTDEDVEEGKEEEQGRKDQDVYFLSPEALVDEVKDLPLPVDGPTWTDAMGVYLGKDTRAELSRMLAAEDMDRMEVVRKNIMKRAFILASAYEMKQEGCLLPRHRLPSYAANVLHDCEGAPRLRLRPDILLQVGALSEMREVLLEAREKAVASKRQRRRLEDRLRRQQEQDHGEGVAAAAEMPAKKKKRVPLISVESDEEMEKEEKTEDDDEEPWLLRLPQDTDGTDMSRPQYDAAVKRFVLAQLVERQGMSLWGKSFKDKEVGKVLVELLEQALVSHTAPADMVKRAKEWVKQPAKMKPAHYRSTAKIELTQAVSEAEVAAAAADRVGETVEAMLLKEVSVSY